MNHELDQLLLKARDLNKGDSGMADIAVRFDPYDGKWIAQASWSCGRRIEGKNASPAVALSRLGTLLDAERAALVS